MQIEKLLEENKEKDTAEILKILAWQQVITSQGATYTGEKDWALNKILDWHKQSLKQFIDGLVEWENERLSNQRRDNGHECYDHNCEYCENAIKDSVVEETISHLKEIRKQLE